MGGVCGDVEQSARRTGNPRGPAHLRLSNDARLITGSVFKQQYGREVIANRLTGIARNRGAGPAFPLDQYWKKITRYADRTAVKELSVCVCVSADPAGYVALTPDRGVQFP